MGSTRSGVRAVAWLVFGWFSLACIPAGRAADEPADAAAEPGALESDRVRRLQADLERLRARTEGLEKTVDDLKKAQATAPREGEGFTLFKGKLAKLYLGALIQMQGEFGDVSSFEGRLAQGPNEINDRFRLRRARLILTGELLTAFDFKIEGDFGQSDGISGNRSAFSATDIWLNWHTLPELNVRAGQYKAPFGLEELVPEGQMVTIERSLVTTAIAPDRQIGVQMWGKPLARVLRRDDFFAYAFGVFNGNGRNATINDNGDFMYAGRGVLRPLAGKLLGQDASAQVGGNAYYSLDAAGTNPGQGNLFFDARDGSLLPFTTLPGTTTSHSPDERYAWGVDGRVDFGPASLSAEYLEARIRPAGAATPNFRDMRPSGYYVMATCFVWKKEWQLVGRWDHFNPSQNPHDDIESALLGVNWFIVGENIKLMADYVHTWSEFRDQSPSAARDEFDQALLRLQLAF